MLAFHTATKRAFHGECYILSLSILVSFICLLSLFLLCRLYNRVLAFRYCNNYTISVLASSLRYLLAALLLFASHSPRLPILTSQASAHCGHRAQPL